MGREKLHRRMAGSTLLVLLAAGVPMAADVANASSAARAGGSGLSRRRGGGSQGKRYPRRRRAPGPGERAGPPGKQRRVSRGPRDARRSAGRRRRQRRSGRCGPTRRSISPNPKCGSRSRPARPRARPSTAALKTTATGRWTPNDPRYAEQWNFRQIGAEKAWEVTRGKGAVVAVIDTGVAFETDDQGCYQAKDFRATPFVPGYDFIHKNNHPNDDQGHGTHVAGTIAESTNNGEGCAGLAYEAKIMPLKVTLQGRLWKQRRHRRGDPLGCRPRRQRDQYEPGLAVSQRHYPLGLPVCV